MARTFRAFVACVVGLSALPLLSQTASAETIRLIAVGAPPPIVTPVKAAKDFVIPEINRRVAATGRDVKIEWTEAWASSLAKFTEVLETVEEGIADLGVQLTVFEPSKLPLEQYSRVAPFGTDDIRLMTRIDEAVRARVPMMNQVWEDKYNQVRLVGAAGGTTDVFTNFPIRSIDDLQGRRLGASGAMGNYLKGTGAVIVSSSMLDAFTSIKNGLYDGYPIAIGLAFPYKVYEVAPYFTGVNFGATVTANLTFNKDRWRKLPAWLRQIIRESAAIYGEKYAQIDEGRYRKFVGIMKKKGVKFYTLPAAERRRWAMAMPNMAKEWADRTEAAGQPGRAVLNAFMDELRKSGVAIMRDWDKE